MFVPFQSLPDHARVWIYQSERKITSEEKSTISEGLEAFTQQWTVHGQPMDASFTVLHDQFIILAANDQASGCSIDSSVRAIKSLGDQLRVDFFNRNLIAFQKDSDVTTVMLQDLKKKFEAGAWNQDSLVFNNLVSTKKELEKNWLIPASASWLKRYLPRETVAG